MKRFAPIFVALLALSMLTSGTAQATDENTSTRFSYHISDKFIQTVADPAHKQVGSIARASGGALAGDRVRITGSGTFNTKSLKATGGGTFVHTDPSGQVRGFGTWKATGLKSFALSGCDGGPFPPNFCGGLAILNVHISATSTSETMGHVEADAVLAVNCLVGGAPGLEGITLNIPGLVNFDTTLPSEHGETLFVKRGHPDDD